MALQASEIKDLVKGTLNKLGRLRFNQIATRLQNYEAMGRIMKRQKVGFDSGKGITRSLMVDHSNAARNVGLYEEDVVNVGDVLQRVEIPWRHTTTNYAFDRRELKMNKGSQRIVNLMKVRRTDGMLALIELMEDNFWGKPEDSSDDKTPFGVPYWLVKNSSTGFNGGAPSGFSDGAGGFTHDRWKNFTGTYDNVTKDDLIRLMRKAHRQTRWKAPVDVPDFRRGAGQRFRFYLNEAVIEKMEELGEAQNENLGRDLASMDNQIVFKNHPLVWVPKLDDDSDNPIYGLDYAWLQPVFLEGEYLHEEEPEKQSGQHTVYVVHIDLTWNLLCTDRRRQIVLYQA